MPKARDESANDHESMNPKARDCGMRRSTSHHGVADADKLAAWIGARENKKNKMMIISHACMFDGYGAAGVCPLCLRDLGLALLPLPHGQRSRLRSPCDGPCCLPSTLPVLCGQPSLFATCCHCQRRAISSRTSPRLTAGNCRLGFGPVALGPRCGLSKRCWVGGESTRFWVLAV